MRQLYCQIFSSLVVHYGQVKTNQKVAKNQDLLIKLQGVVADCLVDDKTFIFLSENMRF